MDNQLEMFSRELHSIRWKNMFQEITYMTYSPTKFSRTELFPALCEPITTICGKSNSKVVPICVQTSCNLFTVGISLSIPALPDATFPMLNFFPENEFEIFLNE